MDDFLNDQIEEIEHFILRVTDTDEFKEMEYLALSTGTSMLDYLRAFVGRDGSLMIPSFCEPLITKISDLFTSSHISYDSILNYMIANNNWVKYYDFIYIHKLDNNSTVRIEAKLFFLIMTGFILDTFKKQYVDISEIIKGERFEYKTNQYGLTTVSGVVFKSDSFIYDGKAYLYNPLTNKTKLKFTDKMPGFAKIITEEVISGDVLLRLDERLAVPENQIITWSTSDFEKIRGPQFQFSNPRFEKMKTIIVHMNPNMCNKLLMVIKKDHDRKYQKAFLHIEIETLPFFQSKSPTSPCITTFLHGMYYPDEDCFTHIDYTKNQYMFSNFKQKYADTYSEVPIDFYAEKKLHYKLWCIENGQYSREIWYKLMISSLPEKYHRLLNEILT